MDVLDMEDDMLELSSGDMRDMWDTSSMLETSLTEEDGEWGGYEGGRSSSVILHDRMITEASLPASCRPENSGDASQAPLIAVKIEDDMEDECFPAISMSKPLQLLRTQRPGQAGQVKVTSGPSMLRPQTIVLTTSRPSLLGRGSASTTYPRLSVKLEPTSSAAFLLPPTPPSSSDSEGGSSPPHAGARLSPAGPVAPGAPRVLVTTGRPSVRHISSALISTTPRGAHGTLYLTEEEKRTLISEGYAIPSRLPLSKAEERSLKKIRRKIKNKISAQESRRKKKEYMDQMERRLDQMAADNDEYRQRVAELEARRARLDATNTRLEQRNTELCRQLEQLRAVLGAACPSMQDEAPLAEAK
ncbi:cyclic AMP response element-binding protein A-like [Pollicipes pollicipes]|uniref:cyclic AMP response element-binding protein A-like n=1 Tax=Pollicipes pollicipes TaxID=41117 RepID=UPI0018856E57|nr:cyclic AMP response element-binding protein A-like [Pollicipes pollicipes]